MKIKYLTLFISVFLVSSLIAQNDVKSPFAHGEPIGKVFANFYSGIGQGNNPTAFEVRRAYFGYKFNMSKEFSAKIQLDIGSPDDVSQYSLLRRFAYFKDAYLQYRKGRVNVKFGIIPLQQFKLQENIWGHRYIYKSVMDEHSLGSSADLGASINFRVNKLLDLDLTLMNGEGYSQPQGDYSYKAGLGFTARPWKGLILRCYMDAIEKDELLITLVNFVGYQWEDKLTAGLEYDLKLNDNFESDFNIRVFSAYASYELSTKFEVFGRYDVVRSNIQDSDTRPWNLEEDGSAAIAGIQYKPISKVRISLSYQDWFPYAGNVDNEAFIYINTEFRIW